MCSCLFSLKSLDIKSVFSAYVFTLSENSTDLREKVLPGIKGENIEQVMGVKFSELTGYLIHRLLWRANYFKFGFIQEIMYPYFN